jgi:sarcosine/dimethylglycine N-methyltransferase
VQLMPFAAGSFDAAISQEALLHVPDKVKVIAEAARVIVPGGYVAFTDWVEHSPMSASDRDLMWRGMAAQNLQTVPGYREALERHGFEAVAVDDLTDWWGPILERRFDMYVALGAEAGAAGHPSGDDGFYQSYRLLVALVKAKSLGGARFVARRKTSP